MVETESDPEVPVVRRFIGSTLIALFALAAPASAEVAHTVAPGESLWSIAAANNLTTRTVAAYNGLSETSTVLVGQTVRVPTTAEGCSRAAADGGGRRARARVRGAVVRRLHRPAGRHALRRSPPRAASASPRSPRRTGSIRRVC